ncbi:MAG: hypothetical protein CMN78_03505 [Spirochaetales bacterium]|nr:hypothetical protein [Spirochaetales bacterium]
MASKQFIYRIQPVRDRMLADGPTEEESHVVSEHYKYLKGLSDSGVVLFAGRTLNTESSSFGIVILLAESEAQAREIMEDDPAVNGRVMRAELYPFRIAIPLPAAEK